MKANELKIIDLMVGDWIYFMTNIVQVESIIKDGMMEFTDGWCYNVEDPLIKPIPITKELLERNGLNLHDDIYMNNLMTLHDNKKFIRTKNAWSVGVYKNGCNRIAHCELTYLHELQHLLRICKIDFEFVV